MGAGLLRRHRAALRVGRLRQLHGRRRPGPDQEPTTRATTSGSSRSSASTTRTTCSTSTRTSRRRLHARRDRCFDGASRRLRRPTSRRPLLPRRTRSDPRRQRFYRSLRPAPRGCEGRANATIHAPQPGSIQRVPAWRVDQTTLLIVGGSAGSRPPLLVEGDGMESPGHQLDALRMFGLTRFFPWTNRPARRAGESARLRRGGSAGASEGRQGSVRGLLVLVDCLDVCVEYCWLRLRPAPGYARSTVCRCSLPLREPLSLLLGAAAWAGNPRECSPTPRASSRCSTRCRRGRALTTARGQRASQRATAA